MWAVFFSDGTISLDDVHNQLRGERWFPVAAIRPKNDPEAPGKVLLFYNRELAYSFMMRNMKHLNWLKGGVALTETDVRNIKQEVMELKFPKRYDSHPEFELTYEVIELTEVPELRLVRI